MSFVEVMAVQLGNARALRNGARHRGALSVAAVSQQSHDNDENRKSGGGLEGV